ncbi:MAG: c-type cytochrome biogenesis protein CcsB [bacterium]
MKYALAVCIALYGAASLFYALAALWRYGFFEKNAWKVLLAGCALNAAVIGLRAEETRSLPFVGPFETVALFAFIVAAVYLALEKRLATRALGLFAAPALFAGMLFGAFHPTTPAPAEPALQSVMFPAHVAIFFLSYAFFTLSFLAAVAYLIQERLLKKKPVAKAHNLFPPLESIDLLCYRLVSLGFPLITLGMVSGMIWAHSAWGILWDWRDPKLNFSLATWLIYAIYLHLRFVGGWQGRRTNVFLILGFLFLIFTFYGVNFLPGGRHALGVGPR